MNKTYSVELWTGPDGHRQKFPSARPLRFSDPRGPEAVLQEFRDSKMIADLPVLIILREIQKQPELFLQ